MEHQLQNFIAGLPWQSMPWAAWAVLLGMIAGSLMLLGYAADWLVKEAVVLSERSGLSKVVIGATIVSLGTTMPEVAVSVLAAIGGSSELAMGNAVGSIICDTGLILGIACLIAPLPLHRNIVNRQGWVQFASGLLLVAVSWPLAAASTAFSEGGRMPQVAGFVMLGLLVLYIWQSIRWARLDRDPVSLEEFEEDENRPTGIVVVKLLLAVALVVLSSHLLIPAVREAAVRLSVPEGIIAATLVAFGTSLPELVTAVTAARRGHGDLAVGNVVGADILNVLFVAGAAAAVTPAGLEVSPQFFRVLFPSMLFVLLVFRIGIFVSGDHLNRVFGVVLLLTYVAATTASYLL
ncbi:MAG: calcium/sodium antiporter [Planctomycetaceae bacterium]|nr:calcium/sodium antiporter [Planctomycetaceae bacterium]